MRTETSFSYHSKAGILVRAWLTLSIFTVSFDIVGVMEISNLTFRLTQLFILPVILSWFMRSICWNGKLVLPVGGGALLIWTLLQMVFVIRSPNLKNAVAYFCWLVFNVCVVFSVSYFDCNMKWLLRVYIRSYIFVACIGLLQFCLFRVGISFFITQTMNGEFGRINGFNYEPSYYATYLLMGAVFVSYLAETGNSELFSTQKLRLFQVLLFITIILSSSRMGILTLGLWVLFRLAARAAMVLKVGRGNKKRILSDVCLVALLAVVAVVILPAFLRTHRFLLSGLGIGGTPSHSVKDRLSGLITCVQIFKNSPLWGYSLGGVDPMIAYYKRIPYTTGDNGAAMSVIGELLVASGLIGLFPLLAYLYQLLRIPKRKSSGFLRSGNPQDIRKGLRYALCFEFIILCMNQNVLRPSLWMHIAIYSTYCRNQAASARRII